MANGLAFSEAFQYEGVKVKERSVTSVADVPDECLTSAFEHLHSKDDRDAVSLTCRRWRALEALSRHTLHFVHDPSDPPLCEADLLHDRLLYALRIFPHISSISINRFTQLPDSFFQLFERGRFAQLNALHLQLCLRITHKCIDYVSAGCPALTQLTLTLCNSIGDTSLHAVARGFPCLEYLDVSYCKMVTDAGIDDVLKNCPNMQDILFSYCPQVEGWGLRNGKNLEKVQAEACNLTDAGLVEGLQGATSIQRFDMADLRSNVRLGERGLTQLGASCKMMQVLCFRMCRVLNNATVHMIAQNCVNLSIWDLSLCQEVSHEGWYALAVHCAMLQFLDVHRCRQFSDASMLAIQGSCPSLCCIHVASCMPLTAESCTRFRISRPNVRVDTQGALTNCCHIT